jgi:hypothetical protein
MSAFDDTKVHAAIARLPRLGSKEVREMKSRAQKQNLPALEAACEAELAARPVEFSGEDALRFEEMAGQVAGLSLTEAIRHAFTSVRRADPDEVRCLRWIAAHPGGTFQAALQAFGKGDLSLVIGHLAYQRLGCFRAFIAPGEDQSSVLLSKDRSGKSVCYTLRPEAETVFRELGLLG